jgi:anti-sigma B factor antagonist
MQCVKEMSRRMQLDREFDEKRRTWNVSLGGEVDAAFAAELKKELLDMITGNPGDIVLDCTGLTYLDSSGLGALVGALNKAAEKDLKVSIKNLKPHIEKIFFITKLDTLFNIEVSRP